MILLGLIFAALVLVFLVAIMYRGYLKDEAERMREIKLEVKRALENEKGNENGKS